MPDESRESRSENPPTLLAWGMPSDDARQDAAEIAAWWLAGGIGLLLWTGLALLLTSA